MEYCHVHWHCQILHATLTTVQCQSRREGEDEGDKRRREGGREGSRDKMKMKIMACTVSLKVNHYMYGI